MIEIVERVVVSMTFSNWEYSHLYGHHIVGKRRGNGYPRSYYIATLAKNTAESGYESGFSA